MSFLLETMLVLWYSIDISSRRKNMRFFVVGIFCLFVGAAFAETSVTPVASQKVSSVTYVDKMSNTVALEKPKNPAPEGRALMWIE